ncbi:P-loop containing nucleoside triphosphate hydrolase protein [Chiua virens]|nr:P-loop containing nucleoside triphosphate hydrolase protein [Chiua virens]
MKREPVPVLNVIVFGESGVGKSSIVNLIAGSSVAKTSPDVKACTTRTQHYDVDINGKKYKLWDTVGLDGGFFGHFRAAVAERNLKSFLRNLLKKHEPSLLVYCVRASRARRALISHYQSVCSATRNTPAPMVIVVTGLEETHGEMEDWWDRNAAELSKHGMEFVDHACITSIDDDPHDSKPVRDRRTYSQGVVRDLVSRNCIPRERREDTSGVYTGSRGESGGWSRAIWSYLASTLPYGQTR